MTNEESSNVLHSSSLLLKVIWRCSTSLLHYMVSQNMVSQSSYGSIIWFLNHRMVQLYGFSIIIWYPKIWFLNHRMVPLHGFSIIIWFHYMVSQSSYGSIIWFLNQKMVFPKDGFLKNLVNYMFPNQTSVFSRYSATDSIKCASTTDSSCFRAIIECITSYDSSVWFKLIL